MTRRSPALTGIWRRITILQLCPHGPCKPKDKAKVEGAVLLAERWILARLRNQTFFSLDELNAAIRPLRDQLNNKVTRHLGASRRALFETLDKPALKSLPHEPYVYAEWKKCRAGLDYHVDIGHHYYSVPHQLMRQELWARVTPRTVEVYHKGQRVAAHQRTSGNRQHSTIRDHMPANHRFRTDWTPERIRTQAARVGPNVETFVEMVMRKRTSRARISNRMASRCQNIRTRAACGLRACTSHFQLYRDRSLHSILKNGLDRNAANPALSAACIRMSCRVIAAPRSHTPTSVVPDTSLKKGQKMLATQPGYPPSTEARSGRLHRTANTGRFRRLTHPNGSASN